MSKSHETINVRVDGAAHYIGIERPEAGNAINQQLIDEFTEAVEAAESRASVVIIEGSSDVFCSGADFKELNDRIGRYETPAEQDPGPLYDLWHRLAVGPFVSIAHVRGRANAGGIGFVSACDIALAEQDAAFSLSELLFGVMPACVLPFLARRLGFARANYLTLTTQPVHAEQAAAWGLVDACDQDSNRLLRRHMLRLRHLEKDAIARYKRYASELNDSLATARETALRGNREVFEDPENLRKIARYIQTGEFPWEAK